MICGVLEVENVVQFGDKTRLDATKSFVTKGEAAISKVEISPSGIDDDDSYIDVTGTGPDDWYLDWVFSGSAALAVSPQLRITTDGDPTVSAPKEMQIVTSDDDKLFSGDKDLMALEPDVMKWVPDGRASWLAVHRAAQEKIIDALNKMGIRATDNTPLTKDDIVDVEEIRIWSRDLTLSLIFRLSQNSKDDFFDKKAKEYADDADAAKDRAFLKLDLNKDGTQGNFEGYDMTARDLVRS
jgi:hypothetical protein